MANSIAVKLHRLLCRNKQEFFQDEIILWGVMVCSNGLFTVTPDLSETTFWYGDSVENFNPAQDLMKMDLTDNEITNNILMAKAAVWVVEKDNGTFWGHGAPLAYNKFQQLYLARLAQLGAGHAIDAFRDILPEYHQYLVSQTSGRWIDDDEIFPYINTEYESNQPPPLLSRATDVEGIRKAAYGGEYEVSLSWSLEIGNQAGSGSVKESTENCEIVKPGALFS